jgi:hypothetical protein
MSRRHFDDFNTPEPTSAEHYDWIAESAGELVTQHELLAKHPRDQATVTATALVEISERAHTEAKDLLLDTVERGYITQRKASEIMGVHEHTIARWLTARTVEQPQAS